MIHNVNSYTPNVTVQEHDLKNCVHKQHKGFLDTGMELKAGEQKQENLQAEEIKTSIFDIITDNIRKALGKGIRFAKGVWGEPGEKGENSRITEVPSKGADKQNGKADSTTAVSLSAMETLADVKIAKKQDVAVERETGKLAGAIPSLRTKARQSRERFEAGKDAFLKRMKEMAKNRKGSFMKKGEERPGQQEKEMEWFETGNSHLLDSYNKNGEYTNLGNRVEGQGYSGSLMKDNYSRKV